MPIAFPLPPRGNPFDRYRWQVGAKPQQYIRAPNLTRPCCAFTKDSLAGAFGWQGQRVPVNVRNLGKFYQHGERSGAVVNPAPQFWKPTHVLDGGRRSVYLRVLGTNRMALSGTVQDCSAVGVAGVRVMLFKTPDNAFVAETVTDGSGNWSFDILVSGPFFVVDYIAGAPDRAGTSANTLTPTQVS